MIVGALVDYGIDCIVDLLVVVTMSKHGRSEQIRNKGFPRCPQRRHLNCPLESTIPTVRLHSRASRRAHQLGLASYRCDDVRDRRDCTGA